MTHGPKLLDDSRWHYQEKLPCGGLLQVVTDTWQIAYIKFVGYPAVIESLHIRAGVVNDYYQAWIKNFVTYEKLVESMPRGSVMTIPGECGMTIRINGDMSGVALFGNHCWVTNRAGLRVYLESYQYASKRAPMVIRALAPMEPLALPDKK